MHVRYFHLVLLWGLTLLLGACADSTTELLLPAYVISKQTDTEYTTLHRLLACRRDHLPFDAGAAYDRYERPLLWTFQVNFDVTSDYPTGGRPLGCLRLYERKEDEDPPRYQAIDDGGIVVDTCGVSDPSVELDAVNGIATLNGNGFVTCTMNLESWVISLTSTTEFSPFVPLLTSFVATETLHVHEYTNFTMIASTTLTQTLDGTEVELAELNPLIHYSPSVESPTAVDLSVYVVNNVVNNRSVTFPATECLLAEVDCDSHDIDTSAVWWYDYRTVEELPYLVYRFQDNSGMSRPWLAPDGAIAYAPVAENNVFSLWIGEATLYIGHNPETGMGRMESLMIS